MNKKHMVIFAIVLAAVMIIMMQTGFAITKDKVVTTWNELPVAVRDYYSDDGHVIGTIPSGTVIEVSAFCGDRGAWASVSYDGRTGYIKTQYLKDIIYETYIEDDDENDIWKNYYPRENPLHIVTPCSGRITGFVYLRYTPENDGVIAKRMPNNAVMTVLAENGSWLQVREEYSGIVGFVKADEVVEITLDQESIRMIQDSYD